MKTPNLILLYVKDPIVSALFYERIFEGKPVAAFPTYVAFTFENDLTVSLWSTKAKNFVSCGEGHRHELAFMVAEENEIIRLRDHWVSLGVRVEQDLHEAVFGLTFVALDPDGHRIRVCMLDK